MEISEKLAFEIYTIIIFHTAAVLLLLGFTVYIFLRAKKTPLLYSYLGVVGMILIWMISKILKTVSPNQPLRWFFIVTQYFGVEFLGLCLILFAFLYTRNRLPTRKWRVLLALPPVVGFLAVLTNPWHMRFYSYFDFYRDKFGPLFLPVQAFQYLYLITGILLLSKGFTHQPGLSGRKMLSRILAVLVLLPLLFNVYYLLFKFTTLKWIFPFPVFDFTPVSGSIALILFMIPALKYRFLEISPVTHRHLFSGIPQGIVFINRKGGLLSSNKAFRKMFGEGNVPITVEDLIRCLEFADPSDARTLSDFIRQDEGQVEFRSIRFKNGSFYRVVRKKTRNAQTLLCFTDISSILMLGEQLEEKNRALQEANQKLEALARYTKELAVTRAKNEMAQTVHDILGHSLTVVIGISDLAVHDSDGAVRLQRLTQIKELLTSSLSDLRNSIHGKGFETNHTTLVKAIHSLKNSAIAVDFVLQGKPYELRSRQTEAIFRLCQEAVTNSIKHGKAKTLHIFLRFFGDRVEVFAIDDGSGCKTIRKNYGLTGMESRILAVGGEVCFGSDAQKGFHIHAMIPITMPEAENVS
jgi:signal transduction histidine kinase